ncbi:hypothetical protein VNO78_07215 [Psophocarpus tetragonolobus]|uniref:Uncharacterized protein n=1 Tax=Psophocarpus tetragonolobus TaxID=3891 RepID=A0AAN9XSK8_PSOTE
MVVNLNANSLGAHQRVETNRPHEDKTIFPSSILTRGLAPQSTLLVDSQWEDVQGEASEYLPENEVHSTTVQNDPPIIERCEGDDINLATVSTSELEREDSSSNTGSDSDDPFEQIHKKFCGSGAFFRDTSLTSIREAIGALEMLMIKDIHEVSSDPAQQSQLTHALDLLTTISHPQVTKELKEALAEFKRKIFATFQDFQATAESLNKLSNFEKQKARIQKDASAGMDRRKDLKTSIKKASLSMKAENSKKKALETEIATLRQELATKEMDLDQIALNVKNLEVELSTNVKYSNVLDEQGRALSKEVDDLVAANGGVKDEGKAAEVKQYLLNSTWSTGLTTHLSRIENNILGLYK